MTNLKRLPIAEQCEGCLKVTETAEGKFCQKYADPEFHWENDQICTFATHIERKAEAAKKAVNPLKASKRASGKKK